VIKGFDELTKTYYGRLPVFVEEKNDEVVYYYRKAVIKMPKNKG